MASIKIKYIPSTVKGRDGTLSFHIINHRQVKHISTGLHINDSEWNAVEASVIKGADKSPQRTKYLSSMKNNLKDCNFLLQFSG